jgi:hypothetical protein
MEANKISNQREDKTEYQIPIPPPSYPRQYRAIGLIYGTYQHSQEKLTKGSIITKEGQIIDAVLLGRIIALIKNHVDLKKEHLWVVYPHSKQENNNFHVQIVGVWEPKTLSKNLSLSLNSNTELPWPDGYFSIRGEVVFYSEKERKVIVRIIQFSPKKSSKPNFLKLELTGILPNDSLGHFFNLEVYLQGEDLIIEKANDLGLIPKNNQPYKRKFFSHNKPEKKL